MEKTVSGSTNANKDSFKNTPHTSGAAGDTKGTMADSAKGAMSDAKSTLNDARTAIADQAAPAMNFLRDNFSTVSERSQVYIKDAGSFIRQYPFYTVLGAVAVGAFVGMAFSRPSRNA